MIRWCALFVLLSIAGCRFHLFSEEAFQRSMAERARIQRESIALRLRLDDCQNQDTQPMRVLVIQLPLDAGSPVEPADAGEIPLRLP